MCLLGPKIRKYPARIRTVSKVGGNVKAEISLAPLRKTKTSKPGSGRTINCSGHLLSEEQAVPESGTSFFVFQVRREQSVEGDILGRSSFGRQAHRPRKINGIRNSEIVWKSETFYIRSFMNSFDQRGQVRRGSFWLALCSLESGRKYS